MCGAALAAAVTSQETGKKRMVNGAWEELLFLLSPALCTSPLATERQTIFERTQYHKQGEGRRNRCFYFLDLLS